MKRKRGKQNLSVSNATLELSQNENNSSYNRWVSCW